MGGEEMKQARREFARRLVVNSVIAVTAGMIGWAGSSGARATTLEELREQGFTRIAIAIEPPYTVVHADRRVSGAAPDVARAVFNKLGVEELVASLSEWGAMIPGLQARRFDVITAGLFIKPERCQAVAYTEPILCDAEAFAVKRGNPLNLFSYADVANNPNAKVGAGSGGVEARLALDAGVPRERLIAVPDVQSGLKMLQDGRIDAYALPVLSVHDLLQKAQDPNLEGVAPLQDAPISCDGAAFHQEDVALRDAFDEVLAEMKESGEFASIIEPYGFSAEAARQTSREQLCSAQD
jgi:polar amino acid transport system substrate-binding protein